MSGTPGAYLRWLRDQWRLRTQGPGRSDEGAVLIVLFHALFQDRREAESGVCDPQQGITGTFFAEFVEALLSQGVAIAELEDALRRRPRHPTVVLTFDDGYYNNVAALPVLREFGVPATFFISTNHVVQGKAFWWDALYRHAAGRGASPRRIRRQAAALKRLRADQIERRITDWFGTGALWPVSDSDRPFTPAELGEFARSPQVFLGNHTSDHAILVNYEPDGMREQIEGAQRFLAGLAGGAPRSIAYPNGDWDARVVEAGRGAGLDWGLTVRGGLNRLGNEDPMALRRITVWGAPPARTQARFLARALQGW